MSVLVVILVLSLLVIIHELGHLMAALWAKITVEEFGLGYPPKVATLFRWRKIPFTLNAIPFGGFVRMAGEEATPGTPATPGDFRTTVRWKRIVVIVAGVTMNALFGVVILSAIYTFTGIPTPLTDTRIGAVLPDSPAAQAGLQADTSITAITSAAGTIANPTIDQVQQVVAENPGKTISMNTTGPCEQMSCGTETNQSEVYVRSDAEIPEGQGAIGIVFQEQTLMHYPFWQMPIRGAIYGTHEALYLGSQIVIALGTLLTQLGSGQVPADVVGPIGIAGQAEQIKLAEQGIIVITLFTAMISINLAIMNILPIPPLDGGRLLFILLEPVVKKERLAKVEYWANYSGFIILIAFILAISAKDIWGLIG